MRTLVQDVSKCLCLCSISLEGLIPCHLADLGDGVYHLPHRRVSMSSPNTILHRFISSLATTPSFHFPSCWHQHLFHLLRYIQNNTHSPMRWLLKVVLPQPLSEAKINMDQLRYELCTYNGIGMLIAEVNQPLMSRGVGIHFHQWFRIQCVCGMCVREECCTIIL